MYAILRTKKLKSSEDINASVSHTLRTIETKNANKLIKNLQVYGNENIVKNISDRLDEVRETHGSKIRKDAVLCMEILQTASPEFFKKDDIDIDSWVDENVRFLKEKYGKNLISCTLHLDETTPHIASYIIPEFEGKLNCKHYLGGTKKLRELQDDYASSMSKFGLKRGIEGSKAKHVTIKQYYSELNKINRQTRKRTDEIKKLISEPPVKGIIESKEKYDLKVKEHNKKLNNKIESFAKYVGKMELQNRMLIEKINH